MEQILRGGAHRGMVARSDRAAPPSGGCPRSRSTTGRCLDAVLDAGLRRARGGASTTTGSRTSSRSPTPATATACCSTGRPASRLFRSLAAGAPTCLTVTLLDGLVLARSAFESSMHYRSAMVLGVAHRRSTATRSCAALERVTEHLMPGRWADARQPNRKELAATLVLALPLDEWSVKVSDGPPDDAGGGPRPAGVGRRAAAARDVRRAASPHPTCGDGLDVPGYVRDWSRR